MTHEARRLSQSVFDCSQRHRPPLAVVYEGVDPSIGCSSSPRGSIRARAYEYAHLHPGGVWSDRSRDHAAFVNEPPPGIEGRRLDAAKGKE
jgi:hypothetical protein